MNILLTGSRGYIATGIFNLLNSEHNIIVINRDIFDLTNYESTKNWFNKNDIFFDAVIHTAISGGNRLLQESSTVLDNNLKMYYNLLEFRSRYNRFINIGSGAENLQDSYYGLSKKIINKSISDKDKFYNLRIYAIFDEREADRRFIKSNILRYCNKNPMIIHQNKYMDFIYFNDFMSILNKYLIEDNLNKEINCVYKQKNTLLDICNIINTLDSYTVDIHLINDNYDQDYTGEYYNLDLNFLELEQSIKKVYRKIKYEKNMVCAK